ncbi:disease resistance protein Roq1-like [Lactuca sativa]|uniref:disease resistance protein Roq1-like n=1 Tax=Lactuca sativa TaxID=4236 RepID=UPI000CD985B5|nr:disease resistance protein Roq1-like [Lactuca sativa]
MDSARRTPKLYSMKLQNTSPMSPCWHYDVFLSFRGEDTRKTFSGDLYKTLIEAGIHIFKDDDELPRGNDIPSELIKAIKESRTLIVVFSKDYASLKWCLDELLEILDSKRTVDQLFFPVFYDVHRDDVHRQTGSFESAFVRHEEQFDRIKVEEWRRVMTEATSLDGWEFNDDTNRCESEFVQRIVMNVLHKIKRKLFVAKHPVGLDSRVEELKMLLKGRVVVFLARVGDK